MKNSVKENYKKIILVWFSLNVLNLARWYLKSPPDSKSITRYKFSKSWKAKCMFTIKLHN